MPTRGREPSYEALPYPQAKIKATTVAFSVAVTYADQTVKYFLLLTADTHGLTPIDIAPSRRHATGVMTLQLAFIGGSLCERALLPMQHPFGHGPIRGLVSFLSQYPPYFMYLCSSAFIGGSSYSPRF